MRASLPVRHLAVRRNADLPPPATAAPAARTPPPPPPPPPAPAPATASAAPNISRHHPTAGDREEPTAQRSWNRRSAERSRHARPRSPISPQGRARHQTHLRQYSSFRLRVSVVRLLVD